MRQMNIGNCNAVNLDELGASLGETAWNFRIRQLKWRHILKLVAAPDGEPMSSLGPLLPMKVPVHAAAKDVKDQIAGSSAQVDNGVRLVGINHKNAPERARAWLAEAP